MALAMEPAEGRTFTLPQFGCAQPRSDIVASAVVYGIFSLGHTIYVVASIGLKPQAMQDASRRAEVAVGLFQGGALDSFWDMLYGL